MTFILPWQLASNSVVDAVLEVQAGALPVFVPTSYSERADVPSVDIVLESIGVSSRAEV